MAHRARKYREIKKRVKVHMKEFLKEDSEGVKIAMESYLKDVTYQRNNTNNFYQLIDNNNENIDSNNYHLYENCVNDLKSDSDDTNDYCEDLNSNFDNESASFSNDNMSQSNSDISIKSEIQKWCIKENIKHSSINKLLKILKVHTNIENLPRDARTLLKTSRTTLVRKLGSSGDLHYIGITPNLQMKHKYYGDTIQLTFNVDGIPIYKSSSKQFWPILRYVIDKQYQYEPFLVSLFLGESKPEPITDYFEDFVPELKKLCENGFFHDRSQMEFKVVIRAFICDTPARCMIKCCKLFNAYSGCDRCEQEGVYINHRMTFPLQNAPLRTDESFASMSDPDHHKSISPLSELNIGLVSQIPLDYMHLVNLGCMRKLLIMLLKGDLRVRLSTNSIHCISNELIAQRMHFPIEFQRKPRSLKEIAYWKASEFRQFLLYSGIVVLNNNVPSAIYKHFLLLHVASTILCSTSLIVHYLNFASDLLRSFVNHWSKLYGADTVVYNVHCLTHLTADAKKYGILDSFSAFPFESFLFQLKRLLRTSNQPLQQIVKRLSESSHVLVAENKKLLHDYTKDKKFRYHVVLNSRHSDGPLTDFPCHVQQFRKVKSTAFTLSTFSGNNCVSMKDNNIVVIYNFVELNKDIYIIGLKYLQIENMYSYPCSSSLLKIFKVSSLSKQYEVWNISSVFCKNVLLKQSLFSVCLPLLHIP